jgi:uncharacterized SAM-binding protein YcdF (DUF218 family)
MSASEFSVVVVLGKGLGPGGVPSDLLRERCILAARAAKEIPEAVDIPTGGDPAGVGVTEAAAMEKILREHGVDKDRIQLEENAFNTTSNAFFAFGLIRGLLGSKRMRLMLVTTSDHMPRSAWIFRVVAKAMGIDLVLEQHPSSWVGRLLQEKGNLAVELRRLRGSPKKVDRFLKSHGLDYERMEDLGPAMKELQEMFLKGAGSY